MNWTAKTEGLCADFEFANFKLAFAFMTEVAFEAEAQAHHPNWQNVYNKVSICLNTHDAGGSITDKDHQLAKAIDEIYERYK